MKRLLMTAMMSLGAIASLSAQDAQRVHRIDVHATVRPNTVSVPFAFEANRANLPAGDYQFRQGPLAQTATLINVKTGQQVMVLKQAVIGTPGTMRFSFRRTGNQYFLRQMWQGGAEIGAELPASPAEREARKAAANPADAGN